MMKHLQHLSYFILIVLLVNQVAISQGTHAREEAGLDQVELQYNLSGENIVIAIIERGIDYFHPDFIDENGNTRLLYLYDMINQEGANDPGNPYGVGTIFTEEDLNESLQNNDPPLSMDRYGHGSAVSGIACGNGSAVLNDFFKGVAPRARIIAVKAIQDYFPPFDDQPGQDAFYNPTYIPIALQFVADKLTELSMKGVALINLGSIGGPTDGTSAICQAMNDFVDLGYPLVCGVGDDGGADNHAADILSQDQSLELSFFKGNTGNLRVDLWYEENDRFQVSLVRPDNTAEGPFAAPATANDADDHVLGDIYYYHRGANVEFAGASSFRRELLIDFIGQTGEYKIILTGSSITGSGIFHATMNPSNYHNNNKFLSAVVSGYSLNDFTSAANVISPGDYVVKNDWIDMNGNSQQINGEGDPGELWLGSSFGPTQDEQLGIDFAACGEVLYGAYSPDTWYAHFPHLLVQGGDSRYGIQNAVSAAAPLTTGVIALMLQVNPNLTPSEIKEILQQTARSDSYTGTVPNEMWGYGKLDAFEAIKTVEENLNVAELQNIIPYYAVYPNPSMTNIYLKSNNPGDIIVKEIRIFDSFGRQILQSSELDSQNISIPVESLKSGIYSVMIIGENKTQITKLVKK